MNKNDVNYSRFLGALKRSLDGFAAEAGISGQMDDPDYLAIKEYLEKQIERLQEDLVWENGGNANAVE